MKTIDVNPPAVAFVLLLLLVLAAAWSLWPTATQIIPAMPTLATILL